MKKLNKTEQGFTIVEIMIVLAIAAVIMLVVFLAVPSLQRNNRNTQRRSDVNHLGGLLNEYAANHSGQMPASFGTAGTCTMSTANENFSIINNPQPATCTALTAGYTAPTAAVDTFFAFTNAQCSNNTPSTGGGARSTIIVFYVEPGTTLQCVQV